MLLSAQNPLELSILIPNLNMEGKDSMGRLDGLIYARRSGVYFTLTDRNQLDFDQSICP